LRALAADATGEGEAGAARRQAAGASLAQLAGELGASPPAAVAALSEAELEDLAGAVRDARRRQAAALARAGDEALGRLPRIVRGLVRRVIGG